MAARPPAREPSVLPSATKRAGDPLESPAKILRTEAMEDKRKAEAAVEKAEAAVEKAEAAVEKAEAELDAYLEGFKETQPAGVDVSNSFAVRKALFSDECFQSLRQDVQETKARLNQANDRLKAALDGQKAALDGQNLVLQQFLQPPQPVPFAPLVQPAPASAVYPGALPGPAGVPEALWSSIELYPHLSFVPASGADCKFLDHLLTKHLLPVPGDEQKTGVETLDLPSWPFFAVSEPVKLVTRPETRELSDFLCARLLSVNMGRQRSDSEGKAVPGEPDGSFADVVSEHSRGRYITLSGHPGIGKSRFLTLLLRAVLQRKDKTFRGETYRRHVVYEARNLAKVWVFYWPDVHDDREEARPDIYVASMGSFGAQHMRLLRDADTYRGVVFLVDTEMERTQNAPKRAIKWDWSPVQMHTGILAASPNPDRATMFGDGTAPLRVMLDMWREEEMMAAAPYMTSSLTLDEVRRRVNLVGRIPRYVFKTHFFDTRFERMRETADKMKTAVVKDLFARKLMGLTDSEVSSALMGPMRTAQCRPSVSKFSREAFQRRLVSPAAVAFVAKRFGEEFVRELEAFLTSDEQYLNGAYVGHVLEAAAVLCMLAPRKWPCSRLGPGSITHHERVCYPGVLSLQGDQPDVVPASLIVVGSNNHDDFLVEVEKAPLVLAPGQVATSLLPGASNQPVFDLALPNKVFVQVTSAKRHPISRSGLAAMYRALTHPGTRKGLFKLVIVVPWWRQADLTARLPLKPAGAATTPQDQADSDKAYQDMSQYRLVLDRKNVVDAFASLAGWFERSMEVSADPAEEADRAARWHLVMQMCRA